MQSDVQCESSSACPIRQSAPTPFAIPGGASPAALPAWGHLSFAVAEPNVARPVVEGSLHRTRLRAIVWPYAAGIPPCARSYRCCYVQLRAGPCDQYIVRWTLTSRPSRRHVLFSSVSAAQSSAPLTKPRGTVARALARDSHPPLFCRRSVLFSYLHGALSPSHIVLACKGRTRLEPCAVASWPW